MKNSVSLLISENVERHSVTGRCGDSAAFVLELNGPHLDAMQNTQNRKRDAFSSCTCRSATWPSDRREGRYAVPYCESIAAVQLRRCSEALHCYHETAQLRGRYPPRRLVFSPTVQGPTRAYVHPFAAAHGIPSEAQ